MQPSEMLVICGGQEQSVVVPVVRPRIHPLVTAC